MVLENDAAAEGEPDGDDDDGYEDYLRDMHDPSAD
jgi:hypothetical protein